MASLSLKTEKKNEGEVNEGEMEEEEEEENAWSWGAGTNGQLGNGVTEDFHFPVTVPFFRGIHLQQIACGGSHAVGITVEGKAFSWGWGHGGCLGHGDEITLSLPKQIESLTSIRIRQAAAGWNHTAFLSETGRLYTCGEGTFGQLGLGNFLSQKVPCHVASLEGVCLAKVACGMRHTLVLSKESDVSKNGVFGWGSGKRGQLAPGGGSFLLKNSAKKIQNISKFCVPQRIKTLDGVISNSVEAGGDHSAIITGDGNLLVWGRGFLGSEDILSPSLASESMRCRQVALGWSHGLLLTEDGLIFGWGSNRYGQLGKKEKEIITIEDINKNAFVPQQIATSSTKENEKTSSVLFQKKDAQEIKSFPKIDLNFVPIETLKNQKVGFISTGSEHSVALLEIGEIFTWGWGEHGQTGNGSTEDQFLPQKIILPTFLPARNGKVLNKETVCGSGFCISYVKNVI